MNSRRPWTIAISDDPKPGHRNMRQREHSSTHEPVTKRDSDHAFAIYEVDISESRGTGAITHLAAGRNPEDLPTARRESRTTPESMRIVREQIDQETRPGQDGVLGGKGFLVLKGEFFVK
ncbi:hypothetical protein Ddc_18131 [Ditylenchus destructor]|nr:hypothetical protein Ddc_18131 [Ditylenchus destructor]